MAEVALEASQRLAEQDIAAEVIDLRSLRPLDLPLLLDSLGRTHRVLIIEEDCLFAGAGAEIAAALTEQGFYLLEGPVARLAGADVPTPYNAELEAASIPRCESVVQKVRAMLRA